MFRNEDLATMRLRARCVDRLETAAGGRLATTYVTWKDLEELGLLEGDQGREMVETAIGLEGAEVGILFRGLRPGEGVKASFRSKTDFDVAAICVARGGGGHRKAAGCTVKDDDLARVRRTVVAEVAAALERTPSPAR
jgi:phosphoesterase RecJ-like protein